MSLNQPSRIVGLFVSAGISEKFGRKRSLILFSLAQIAVSFAVFLCNSYITLMVALIFSGFFNCMVMNPSFALLSEISVIKYRSSVASLNTLMSNLGWLIGISLGLVVPLQFYSLALCFPSILFLLVSWAVVESPIWLLRRDDKDRARATLQWLRGQHYDLELEMKELETIVEQERREEGERSVVGSVLDRTFLLPLLISCLAFTFNALCGVDLLGYYVGFIFPQVRLEVAAMIFQSMITLGYLSSPLLLTRLDCRHLNTIFLSLTGLGMFVMGLSLTWSSLAWLSTPCLVMTGLSYGLGVGPSAYVLMSTIFTQKMKSTGVTTGQVVKAIMVTVQLKVITKPSLPQVAFPHVGLNISELSLLETNHRPGGGLFHQHGRLSGRGSLLDIIHSENKKQNYFRTGDFVRETV